MTTRRDFIKSTGIGLLAFTVAGEQLFLTPAQAKSRELPFTVLSKDEVTLIEVLADTILPGAGKAGIAHFIDQQLSSPIEQCLLIIRYLGVPYPYRDFYKTALAAVESACKSEYDRTFSALKPQQATEFIKTISSSVPDGWQGPPAPFFYYVLRSDAIDVVYGTEEGFEKLNIPYMAHIKPASPW